MIPLVLVGLGAIALIAIMGGQGKGGVYNILFQSPAVIQASAASIAQALGFDPNGVNYANVNTPSPGNTVLTVAFKNDYAASLPKVNQTVNLYGVPATVRSVQKAPVQS